MRPVQRKPFGSDRHVIAVIIPGVERLRKSGEQAGIIGDVKNHASVFAFAGAGNFSAECVRDPLQAVANSENGYAEIQHAGIAFGSACVIDGTWPTGKDDSDRSEDANILKRSSARQNGGENLLLADSTRDELRILPAKIQDDDSAEFGLGNCAFHSCR